MRWILASASPRRKELLAEILPEFEIIPSLADETVTEPLSPKQLVEMLATRKAFEVASRTENEGKFVLGSDTVVAYGDEVLGKPKDEADAVRMLSALSGRAHEVYTGVCIVYPNGKGATQSVCAVDQTKVLFATLSRERIKAYVATGSPMDKAGAYGIQDGGLVEEIQGSESNVIGLPVELCERLIRQAGI